MIRLAIILHAYAGCQSRQIMRVIETFNMVFHKELEVPSHQTILDWIVKSGIAESHNISITSLKDGEAYHIITDNSVCVNGQELHLELISPAKHPGHAIMHSDVRVAKMKVGKNWNGDNIKTELDDTFNRLGANPEYALSDNGGNICKAVRETGIPHHRDITHSFGMALEHAYSGTDELKAFDQGVAYARKFIHTDMGCLMPPPKRAHSRFINLFDQAEWAYAVMNNFWALKPSEQDVFAFVRKQASFTEELKEVLASFEFMEKLVKEQGLSHETADTCKRHIVEHFCGGTDRQRMLGEELLGYFNREVKILTSKDCAHNVASDIIESTFGYTKERMSSCKNSGFTSYVLVLPLHLRLACIDDCKTYDAHRIMEQTHYADIKEWRKSNLLPSPICRRRYILKADFKFGTEKCA